MWWFLNEVAQQPGAVWKPQNVQKPMESKKFNATRVQIVASEFF